jgi:hypothetical protein
MKQKTNTQMRFEEQQRIVEQALKSGKGRAVRPTNEE